MPVKNAREVIVTIDDFRTLARKTRGELLSPNIGNVAQNCRFTKEIGSIEKRYSRAKYSGMSSLGTARISFIDRYYKNSDSTRTLIVAYDTTLKKGNDTTGAFTNIKTGLTAGLHWNSVTFKDLWYGCNGTDTNQVYDGTNVENMGVPVPTAPTFNAFTGTGLTGDYKYKITYFIDGYQEGNASTASATISPSNQQVTLNIPVSTNTRVTKRWLYRTTAGGSVYNFCKEIANNTDATVTDGVADGSLDTTITAPSDYGAPAAFTYMCLHKSRIFGLRSSGNLSRAIYSDIRSGTSYPDIFPVNNFFDVIKDNGEEGTVIVEDHFGQLIVMKPSAVIKINTETDDPVGWSGFSNIISVNGCIAPKSIAKTPYGLFYLSLYAEHKKRLVLWDGQSSKPVFEELEPVFSSIIGTRLAEVESIYYDGSLYISYTDPDGGNTFNDRVLIIDLITSSWVIDKKNVDCFSKWTAGTMDNGELYTGTSDTTGFIYREDTNIQDLVIRYKSEIDLGTLDSNLTSSGTEQAPVIGLNSGVSDDVGTKIVSTVLDTVSTLTDDQESVAPSGLYTSQVYEVNAKNLVNLYWTQQLGSNGIAQFWIRTGATEAATTAAAWSGPYSTASGSDISAVTANRYIQFKFKLFVKDPFDFANVYLERGTSPNDYVVKMTFGLGSITETSIEMIYESSWMDFGWLDPRLKRARKCLRQTKIEFERATASGTLTYGYYLNGSSSRTDKNFSLATYASKGYCIYQYPFATYARNMKFRLYHADDTEDLKITAVHHIFTVEPVYQII